MDLFDYDLHNYLTKTFWDLGWETKIEILASIADGGHGSVCSAKLKNGIKGNWNFINQDWEYDLIDYKIALKEIKDSRYDIAEFLKVVCFFILEHKLL